jgi:hypothetical protein
MQISYMTTISTTLKCPPGSALNPNSPHRKAISRWCSLSKVQIDQLSRIAYLDVIHTVIHGKLCELYGTATTKVNAEYEAALSLLGTEH